MSKSVAIPTNISMNRIAGLQASLQSIAVKDSVAIWINQRARSIGIRGDEANALRAQQSVVGVLQSISDSEPVNIDPHMTEVVSSETIIPQRHVTNNYTIPSGVPIGCLVGKNGYHVKHCMAEFRVKAWVTEETNLRLVGKTNEDIDRAETYFKALFVKYDNSSNCRAKLPIPDHIPVGFIIGKNGNQLRALSSRYKVSAWVELEDMTLNISGSSWSIAKAVKEAKSLFLHYEGHHRVQNMPLFVCYPEARLFTFAESTNQLDSQSVARPFQLIVTTLANYQVHSQISDSGFSESECSDSARWIKSFCPSAITTWAETEVAKSEIQSPQVRIQIGEIGFKLQKYGNVHPSMAYPWQQLRQFRRNVDFLAKFSPIVNINVPEIGRLYNQLCELIDVENPEIVFDAYLGQHECLDYAFINRAWQLTCSRRDPMRRVPFTVYHRSNSVLRINTIGQLSEGAENNTSAGDYVLVSNLESFWDTTVTLTDSAPLDCFIALQSIKLQYRMEFNGLLFHLSFSGPNHALPRISATLASPSESHSANAVELYNSMIRMLAYDDVLEAHVEQFKHMNFASADD